MYSDCVLSQHLFFFFLAVTEQCSVKAFQTEDGICALLRGLDLDHQNEKCLCCYCHMMSLEECIVTT